MSEEQIQKLARLMYEHLEGEGSWPEATRQEREDFERCARWIGARW